MTDPAVGLTVVIATYGREAELVQAVTSVRAQLGDDAELVVVDQTERHEQATQRFLDALDDPRVRVVTVDPPSLPAARNHGTALARGAVVLFVDDDVTLHPGCLDAHRARYADPAVGAVAGRVRVPGEPAGTRVARIDLLGSNQGSFDVPDAHRTKTATNTVRGCNMSFRVEALRAAGGFDTVYVGNAYREESDVTAKVLAAGWRVTYAPDAALDHHVAPTGGCRETTSMWDRSVAWRNEAVFQARTRPRGLRLAAFAVQVARFSLSPEVLRARVHGRRLAAARAGWREARAVRRRPPAPVVSVVRQPASSRTARA